MKKYILHLARYIIVIFPILFLPFVLAHTHYYKNQKPITFSNHLTNEIKSTKNLTPKQLQNIIEHNKSKNAVKQIVNQQQWKNIIHQIAMGNNKWVSLIPNILPYTPTPLQQQLNKAITQALLRQPEVILRNLALTNLSIQNTNKICKASSLTQNEKLQLISSLKSIHSLSLIYQQQNCLQTLFQTIKNKKINIS